MLGNALGPGAETNSTKEAPEESFQQKYRKQMKKDLDEIESMEIDEDEPTDLPEDSEIEVEETEPQLTIDDILGADDEEE